MSIKNKINIFVTVALMIIISQPNNLLAQKKCTQTIIDDMSLPGDAPLHGTDTMIWGMGNALIENRPVPAKNYKGQYFTAMTNWGQVYIPRKGSKATNTRCQIRNVTTKLLLRNGTWQELQSGNPAGAAFVENFSNNISKQANIREETLNGGGISVIIGIKDYAGYNFHFWSASPTRIDIDTSTIVAVYTFCEARLIIDDPKKADDRVNCKNILMMGGDWWLNKTTGWEPDWSANSGIAGGRSKWVTSKWQTFNMCTLPPDEIRKNPPCGK